MPHATTGADLDSYVRAETVADRASGRNMRAYMVSLLKAWWGDAATAGQRLLLRLPAAAHRQPQHVRDRPGAARGRPARATSCSARTRPSARPTASMQRLGLANLDWLVVRDFVADRERHLLEGRAGDRDRRAAHRGHRHRGVLPARRGAHREGRQLHQHPADAAVAPQGGRAGRRRPQRPVVHLPPGPAGSGRSWPASGRRDGPAGARPDLGLPDRRARWPSPTPRRCSPRSTAGTPTASRCPRTPQLKDDGSTACGCWIYCGVYADGVNQAARRKPGQEQSWVAPEWGWAWPANRRILYNRASADPDGKPWSERKAYVWWDAGAGEVDRARRARLRPGQARRTTGRRRTPPAPRRSPASTRSSCRPTARRGCSPRRAWSTARCRRTTSRRSRRCTTRSTASSATRRGRSSRARKTGCSRAATSRARTSSRSWSTTYRLTEHHTAGGMCRWLPYLAELQPEMFCEVSPELAAERGLEHLGWATIVTARNAIEARVLVTERMPPLTVGGRTLHQIGLPYHWGPNGLTTGDAANELAHLSLDPNVHIQEDKALAVRHPAGPAAARAGRCAPWSRDYQDRAGITEKTGTEAVTELPELTTAASDPAALAGYDDHPPRMGFFTDTSVCIGCKACEVACKEWNAVPEDGLELTGMSYDNTGRPGAATWRHVAFIEQIGRPGDATTPPGGQRAGRQSLADVVRRVQALHARRLPGRLPDRRAVPHRVRHRGRPGGRLQRLRLLRPRLPVRRHRPARETDGGALQVHAVLRPARRRAGAGLREGLPDRVDPVRPAGRAARAGATRGSASCTSRGEPRRGCTATTRRRRRRRRRVLPAARRARGLRAAARPGGHHPRPAADVAARRRSPRRRPLRRVSRRQAPARGDPAAGRLRGERAATQPVPEPSSPPTTAGRSSRSRSGSRPTSPATCSSAGWPAPPRCSPAGAHAYRATGAGPRARRPRAAGADRAVAGGAGPRPRPARRGSSTCCGCSR